MMGYSGQGAEGVRGGPAAVRDAGVQDSAGGGHPCASMMMRGSNVSAAPSYRTPPLPAAYQHAAAAHAHAREHELGSGDLGASQQGLHSAWDSLPAAAQRRPSWGGGFLAAGGEAPLAACENRDWGGHRGGVQGSMMMHGGARGGGGDSVSARFVTASPWQTPLEKQLCVSLKRGAAVEGTRQAPCRTII